MARHEFRFKGKALSVIQPAAAAIVFAGKDIENRSWQTHYRGPIAIHASGKLYRDDLDEVRRAVRGGPKLPLGVWINNGRRQYGLEAEDEPGCSQFIAVAMLVDCVRKSSSPWFNGEWGWRIQGVCPIEPIPAKGTLGLWECSFKYTPLMKKH